MIRLSKTKILNSIDRIDCNLNTIYNLDTDYERLEKQMLIELLETIKDWKSCLEEIEMKIHSIQLNDEKEDDTENNTNLILY